MFRITFVVQPAEKGGIDPSDLQILLEALTRLDQRFLREHPTTPLLYESGVRYQEEPPGAEDWQDIPTCLAFGYGDCEDLACWRAAEYRERFGIAANPCFTCEVQADGARLYHIMVELPDGRIECPSRVLGMR